MAINFLNRNSASDSFNSQTDRLRTQQKADDAEAADAALQKGIAAYYASRGARTAAPAPAAPPMATPNLPNDTVSGIPVSPALPTTTPTALPTTTSTALPTTTPTALPTGYSGPSQGAEGATVSGPVPTNTPPVKAAPVVVASGGPATAATPSPAAGGGGAGDMAPIIQALAKTPGTGNSMMHLFSTDLQSQRAAAVENRRINAEAEKEVYNHIKNGDWRIAQSISKRYGLNIPDEVFQHRGAQQLMTIGARMADMIKGADEQQKSAYMLAFTEGMMQHGNEQNAHVAGLKAVQNTPKAFKAAHFAVDENNNVVGFDANMTSKTSPVKARQSSRGEGGGSGSSATERIVERLMKENPKLSYADAVAQAKRAPRDDTVAKERLAQNAAKNDRNYRRDPEGTIKKWRSFYANNDGGKATPQSSGDDVSSEPDAKPAAPSNKTGRVREYVPGKGFVDVPAT